MARATASRVTCANCKQPLEPRPANMSENPLCPGCGSIRRAHFLGLEPSVTVSSTLGYQSRDDAGTKFGWGYIRRELFGLTGRLHRVERHFLRRMRGDKYVEHITDAETGALIRHLEEPLSEHKGHGSDKKNRPTPKG